jgi:alkylhydroperoxidase/carboxymuconolactone decarboxylase family protein YurZ
VAPTTLDPVMVQLVMFAILCFDRDEEALAHARIALRQGASVAQLLDVIRVTGWMGGAQAYNMGFRSLQRALADEGRTAAGEEA